MKTSNTIKQDWKNFSEKIAGYKGQISFENLCKELKGHNLDEGKFDVNYGNYCYTVRYDFTVTHDVEVWKSGEYFNLDLAQEETVKSEYL